MKKLSNLSSFLCGVLVTVLVFGVSSPAFAAVMDSIQIVTGIKVFVDDKELDMRDVNGKKVEAFVSDGTTYLPVRAVSEALGLPVQWDGAAWSVYVGKHTGDTPAAYLCQLDYFSSTNKWNFGNITKDNLGNEHSYSIDRCNPNSLGSASLTYKLNGQYSRFTALYYKEFEYRSHDQGEAYTLVISGDGRELWRGSVGAGIDPVDIDIDITGVLELTIEYPKSTSYRCYSTALGEAALWT